MEFQFFVDRLTFLADDVKERRKEIDDMLRDELEHFFLEVDGVPKAVYLDNENVINILINSMSKAEISKAWRKMQNYITKEYFRLSKVRYINTDNEQGKIARATIFKFIKNTVYGARVDELGIKGSTRSNLMKQFMSESAYQVMMRALAKRPVHPSVLDTFGSMKKIEFIYSKLKEVEPLE